MELILKNFAKFLQESGLSKNTVRNYLVDLSHFIRYFEEKFQRVFSTKELKNISVHNPLFDDYFKYLKKKKIPDSTQRRYFAALNRFLDWVNPPRKKSWVDLSRAVSVSVSQDDFSFEPEKKSAFKKRALALGMFVVAGIIAAGVLGYFEGASKPEKTLSHISNNNNFAPEIFAQDPILGTRTTDSLLEINTDFRINGLTEALGGINTEGADIDADSGNVFASNLIYDLVAGTGITVSEGQTPTITNTDLGSSQNIFKTITVGTTNVTADNNDDALTLKAGSNITLSASTTDQSITITGTASYTSWTLAGDSGSSQTVSDGNTATFAGGTNGIDTVAGSTDTVTLNLDTTEIGTSTFGSGTNLTWTFDASTGTDPTILFADGSISTTLSATGLFNVLTGNLKIGNGTPTVTLDGEDAYIEGNLEVDGGINFAPASTSDINLTTDTDSLLNIAGLASGSGNALCVDGSSNVVTCTVGTGGISGSGTAGQIAFFDSASSVTSETSGFGWDATNNLLTIAGSADGTDALVLTAGDILVSNGDLDLSGGDFNVTLDAGDGVNIAKGAAPTVDVFTINGSTSTTDGVDNLQLTFGVSAASGNVIDITPSYADATAGATSEDYYIIDIDAFTATQNAAGDTGGIRGLNIGNLTQTETAGTLTAAAIQVGTGWDDILNYNGTSVINGTGQIVSTQVTGTLFTLTGTDSGTNQTIVQGDTLTIAAGTGIDTTPSATDTLTVAFDSTEIGTTTWGSGSSIVWTFDAGAVDPTIDFNTGAIVFNEAGADIDFRIEGDNNANLLTLDAGLFSGVGQFSIGSAAQATVTAFTVIDNPAITATSNQNFYKMLIDNSAAVTVSGATTSSLVASLAIDEPNITATGTVTNAATLYVSGAPTEGSSGNFAVWVDNGESRFENTPVAGTTTASALSVVPAYVVEATDLTLSGLRVALDTNSNTDSGDIAYGVNIDDITSAAGPTEYGLRIGSGYDYQFYFELGTRDLRLSATAPSAGTSPLTATIPALGADDTFCLATLANCFGGGGGAGVTYTSQTTNALTKFTSTAGQITSSSIIDDGTTISVAANVSIALADGTGSIAETFSPTGTTSTARAFTMTPKFGIDVTDQTLAGLYVNPNTNSNTDTGDTLHGVHIDTITASSATENGITIGSGWDNNVNFNDTTTRVLLSDGGTIVIHDGTNTLCTVTDSGTTGDLSCTGNITGGSSGTSGFWSRTGTTLSPSTANDIVSIANTTTTGADLAITNTGAYTGTGIFNLTANSATTGNLAVLSGTGMTTGELLDLTATYAPTDASTNEAIDINITHTPTTLADNFRSIDLVTTDGTALANTVYGIKNTLTLTGNAAKVGRGIDSSVSSSSTTGDNIAGFSTDTTVTGIITTGSRNVFGLYAVLSAGAESTGGTTNVHGLYAEADGDVGVGGIVNTYGVYIANGTTHDLDGTSAAYGLSLEPMTGADTNVGICFDCDDDTFGTSTVASGIQFGIDANAVTLYRSANDTLRTGDNMTVDLDVTVSGGDITGANSAAIDVGEATSGAITFTAGSAGDFVFTVDSDTDIRTTGGADGTDALVIPAGDILLSDGDLDLSGGDFNVTLDAGDGVNIAKGAAPTVDVFTINGSTSTTDGVDGLQLTYGVSAASGNVIDITPSYADATAGATSEDYYIIDIDAFTATQNAAGDTGGIRGLNIGNLTQTETAGTLTAAAIQVGTGWDTDLAFADTSPTVTIANTGTLTVTDGTNTLFSIADDTSEGDVTVTGDLAVNGATSADVTSSTTTATLFNSTVTTLSVGGAATTLNIGTTDSVTRTLNIGTGTGADTINIGTGATTADSITFGNTGVATDFNFNSGAATVDAFDIVLNSLTTASGFDIDANALTTGTVFDLASTSTVLTSGRLVNLDWSPGSATIATGDLFRINIGSSGTAGNLLAIYDNTSELFSVDEAKITSALPHEFTAAGDVSMAYDLVMTNQTASSIQSYGPLTIEAGESFENNSLTLKTYGTGQIVTQGSFNGTNITSRDDETATSTNTITGRGMVYYLHADTNTTDLDITTTYNVTGVPDTYGTVVFINSVAEKGISAGSRTHTVAVQINGTQVSSVATATGTGASTVKESYTIVRSYDAWKIVGSTGTSDSADYSEMYQSTIDLQSAELVSLVPDNDLKVQRAVEGDGSKVIGITSTNPAFIIGEEFKDLRVMPVALSGRVPVKIDPSSDSIAVGDLIGASSNPGKGRKVSGGYVVGRALQSWSPDSNQTTIKIFVNPIYVNENLANSMTVNGNGDIVSEEPAETDTTDSLSDLTARVTNLESEILGIQDQTVETYEFSGTLGQGEIGSLKNTEEVEQATPTNSQNMIGVVNTISGPTAHVATTGQAQVTVTSEHGAITKGDFITVSNSTPGFGTKATSAGMVVGVALEDFPPASPDGEASGGRGEATESAVAAGLVPAEEEATTSVAATSAVASESAEATPSGRLADQPQEIQFGTIAIRVQPMWYGGMGSDTLGILALNEENANPFSDTKIIQPIEFNNLVTMFGDLQVAGKTTVNDLSITGDFSAGLIKVDGVNSSISTLGSALKLQDGLLAGNIEAFGGKIVMTTDGSIEVLNNVTAKKYNVDTSDVAAASAGTTIIPAGEDFTIVETTALTTKSLIFVTPDTALPIGSWKYDETSFVIELQQPTTEDVKVNWWIIN